MKLAEQISSLTNDNRNLRGANEKLIEEKKFLFDRLKIAEQSIERLEHLSSLSESASEIAHEINNPVNFVSGSLSIIKRGIEDFIELMNIYKQLDGFENQPLYQKLKQLEEEIDVTLTQKELNEATSTIQKGMERIHEIAHNLSLLGKGEAAKPVKIDVNTCITDTLMMIQEKIEGKIEIHLELGDIPEIISYRGKLNQVFTNIIKNAVDAIEEKKSLVENCLTFKTTQSGENIVVLIKDTGKGMTEETKEKLFEKFYTTKNPRKGAGLGMGLCRAIIENHKGTIKFESQRGKGTEFTITLPITH